MDDLDIRLMLFGLDMIEIYRRGGVGCLSKNQVEIDGLY